MDYGKYNAVKAAPPAGAVAREVGESPLQGNVKEAFQDGEWRSYQGVPTDVVGTKKRRGDGGTVEIKEFQALSDELKRAARQLGLGINIRVTFSEDNKTADVYFRVSEKRKYEKREGKAETPEQETPEAPKAASKK